MPGEVESGEDAISHLPPDVGVRDPRGSSEERGPVSTPDGVAPENTEDAQIVRECNLTCRLVDSHVGDATFGMLMATLAAMGFDAVNAVAAGDPGELAKAVAMGFDRKHIDALVTHISTLVFNVVVRDRDRRFDQDASAFDGAAQKLRSRNNPIVSEVDWDSHGSASEIVLFKDMGRDPRLCSCAEKALELG